MSYGFSEGMEVYCPSIMDVVEVVRITADNIVVEHEGNEMGRQPGDLVKC